MTEELEENNDNTISIKSLRKVFKRIHSPDKLSTLELCDLKIVEQRLGETPRTKDRKEWGRALRDVLKAALETVSNMEDEDIKQGAGYLRSGYIEKRIEKKIDKELFDKLMTTKSDFYRKGNKALNQIVKLLRKKEIDAKEYILVYTPIIFFRVPNVPEHTFIGRDEVFNRIKHRLTSNLDGATIAITGPAGIGKSMLAVKLAHDETIKDHFHQGIFWIGMGSNANILGKLGEICIELGGTPGDIAGLKTVYDYSQKIGELTGGRRFSVYPR